MSIPEYGITEFQKSSSHLIVSALVIGTLLYLYAFSRRTMYGYVPSFIKNFSLIRNMNFFALKNFVTFIVFLLLLIGFMGILDFIGQIQSSVRQPTVQPSVQEPKPMIPVAMYRRM